ncbi:hypothetical protein PR048_012110 [Dryococelus australis]|uniref:Uncharacterized protein n=1 Tax=Dryococelus australis TaxID=614101 RepID=A0ABQ9HNH7_9NEOP|nr:hypothetical protein PR048_012110 [Dryococelus australis]
MRVIEVSMEQRRNEGARDTEDLRENQPSNGIVRHDSHMRKSGVTRPGITSQTLGSRSDGYAERDTTGDRTSRLGFFFSETLLGGRFGARGGNDEADMPRASNAPSPLNARPSIGVQCSRRTALLFPAVIWARLSVVKRGHRRKRKNYRKRKGEPLKTGELTRPDTCRLYYMALEWFFVYMILKPPISGRTRVCWLPYDEELFAVKQVERRCRRQLPPSESAAKRATRTMWVCARECCYSALVSCICRHERQHYNCIGNDGRGMVPFRQSAERRRDEFDTVPTSHLTGTRLHDKSERDGTVCDMKKGWCCRKRATNDEENVAAGLHTFSSSPEKSNSVQTAPAVDELFDCLPPIKANWVQFPPGSLPNFRKRESCRTIPLLGGISLRSPVSPTIAFRRFSRLTPFEPRRWLHSKYESLELITEQQLTVGQQIARRTGNELVTSETSDFRSVEQFQLASSTVSSFEELVGRRTKSSWSNVTKRICSPARQDVLASRADECGSARGDRVMRINTLIASTRKTTELACILVVDKAPL